MKKYLAALVMMAITALSTYAQQNRAIQLFMPKTVFVGDTAELRYIFQTEADLFGDRNINRQALMTEYSALRTADANRDQRCHIKSAIIEHTGTEYTLIITLIPWKAGEIDFLPFDLAQWIRASQQKKQYGATYDIDLKPVTVHSLVNSLHITSVRPSAAPLMVPGTSILLVLIAAALVVIHTLLIALLMRLKAFTTFMRMSGQERYLHRQAKNALKKLRRLQKADAKYPVDDRAFCARIQHILRDYLNVRFNSSFESLATPAMAQACTTAFGGDLTDREATAIDSLTGLFMRTDYVRFASDADLIATTGGTMDKAACIVSAETCISLFDSTSEPLDGIS
ncbi:MAG: hypothetical protein K6G80_09190 [Treponema sp.]|nr:hypothetical protein [Treponema sp.]